MIERVQFSNYNWNSILEFGERVQGPSFDYTDGRFPKRKTIRSMEGKLKDNNERAKLHWSRPLN